MRDIPKHLPARSEGFVAFIAHVDEGVHLEVHVRLDVLLCLRRRLVRKPPFGRGERRLESKKAIDVERDTRLAGLSFFFVEAHIYWKLLVSTCWHATKYGLPLCRSGLWLLLERRRC